MTQYGAIIAGTGSYLPEKRLTNEDLSRMVDTSDEWIVQRTGIKERRIAGSSRELQQIPPRTIEETRLKRAVAVAEGLYTNLKARYAEAQLSEASATPDISVLDTAIAPLSPSSNTAPMIILIAFAATTLTQGWRRRSR